MSMEGRAALHKSWQSLCRPYQQEPAIVEQLWQELEEAYSAPGRYYHNLEHLAQLLNLAHRHSSSISNMVALRFAVFYHDAVYNPLSKTNEEDSALLACERLQKLGVGAGELREIQQMILATKSHAASTHADTNLLLDFDLSILSAPWPAYLRYTRQIRQEYRQVPLPTYKQGRLQVLEYFINLPHIYKTPYFKECEAKAKENIGREIASMLA